MPVAPTIVAASRRRRFRPTRHYTEAHRHRPPPLAACNVGGVIVGHPTIDPTEARHARRRSAIDIVAHDAVAACCVICWRKQRRVLARRQGIEQAETCGIVARRALFLAAYSCSSSGCGDGSRHQAQRLAAAPGDLIEVKWSVSKSWRRSSRMPQAEAMAVLHSG